MSAQSSPIAQPGMPRRIHCAATIIVILGCLCRPAMAEPKAKPVAAVSEVSLLQTIMTDAKAALDDATTNNDTIAAACWTAIHAAAQAKLAATHVPGAGLLYAFQKIRDLTRLNSSPIGTSLILGCAPLVQDARLSMVQFFGNIGATVLLKGVLL